MVNCEEAIEYKKLYNNDRHEIKVLDSGVVFASDIIITDNKIFMVGYSESEVAGTEIWNEELAKTQKAVFEIVWKMQA